MSNFTNTNTEVLYSYANASTNLATFTAEDNLQKTYPPVLIPAGFFFNAGATGKTLRVKASGQLGFTTGAPTFTFTARLIASATWSAAGVPLGSTVAQATGASAVVTCPWTLDLDVTLRTLGTGAASTLVSTGLVSCPAGFATPFVATIPSLAVSPAVSTFDNALQYWLYVSAACGTSNALNLANMQSLKVYGEN